MMKRSKSNNLAVGELNPETAEILLHHPALPGVFNLQAPMPNYSPGEIAALVDGMMELNITFYGEDKFNNANILRCCVQGQMGHLQGKSHRGQNLKKNESLLFEFAAYLRAKHTISLQLVCQEGKASPQLRYSGSVVYYLLRKGMDLNSISEVFENTMGLVPPHIKPIHNTVWPTGANHIGVVKTLLAQVRKGLRQTEGDDFDFDEAKAHKLHLSKLRAQMVAEGFTTIGLRVYLDVIVQELQLLMELHATTWHLTNVHMCCEQLLCLKRRTSQEMS